MPFVFRYRYLTIFLLSLLAFSFFACRQLDVYEKNISIPGYKWASSFQPSFEFSISDTAGQYEVFLVLRHTDAYSFNNIWLNVGIQEPGESKRVSRVEFVLGSDQKGWEGTGMNDIWEVRKPLSKGPVRFKRSGTYVFSLEQIMRQNPLPGVMSAGIRVERVR